MRRRDLLQASLAGMLVPKLADSAVQSAAQRHSASGTQKALQPAGMRSTGTTHSGIRAYVGDLTYSGTTAPALVVELGLPWRFVSWADAQYVPCWDIDGLWYTSEWLETLGTKSAYDFEPISDKKLRYTHVELAEVGPARAVVHWRYTLCDTKERIFHGNTRGEEFHTIYPDGFTVRKLVAYPGTGEPVEGQPVMWEVGEILLVHPQGSRVEDNLGREILDISNIAGDTYRHRFDPGMVTFSGIAQIKSNVLCRAHPASRNWSEFIWLVHLKNRPSPFVIVPNRQDLFPHLPCAVCGGDHPHTMLWQSLVTWKNWPQWKEEYEIGVGATEADLKTRSLTTCVVSIQGWNHPTARYNDNSSIPFDPKWSPPPSTTWLMFQGVNPGDANYPRQLAASWLHPAEVKTAAGRYLGYEPAERAYRFESVDHRVDFELRPAADSPQVNPVVIVENWAFGNPRVTVDQREPAPQDCAVSWAGTRLIVWLRCEVEKSARITIQGWPEVS